MKITPKDSDADVIGSISIKWVLWNETTDQYEEIPPAEIARTCDPHYFHIDVRDYRFSDAGERDEVQFDPNAGDITFNRDWHVKEPVETTDSSKLWAESISLGYGTPAIQALFSIRQDRQYSYN